MPLGIIRVKCEDFKDAEMYAEEWLKSNVPMIDDVTAAYPFAIMNTQTGLSETCGHLEKYLYEVLAKYNSVEKLNAHFTEKVAGQYENAFHKLHNELHNDMYGVSTTLVRRLAKVMDLTRNFANNKEVDVLKDFYADNSTDFIEEGGLAEYDTLEPGTAYMPTFLAYIYCEY